MKLSTLSMAAPIKKDILVDISASMVHAVPELITITTVWKEALWKARVVPSSIKSDNARILATIRASKTTHDLPSTVLALLPNMGQNLETLSKYIISSFPPEYMDSTATVKQKVTMAYLSLFYHITIYLPDLVSAHLQQLWALESSDAVYDLPARKRAELADGLITFAVAVDVLGIEPKLFTGTFDTDYLEVESKSGIDSLLASYGLSNPLARVSDNFRGNPFFAIGKWMNTTVVNYVKYTEDRRRVAKLYLEQIKAEHAQTGSPAAAKEIELLEADISDLEYRLHKATS